MSTAAQLHGFDTENDDRIHVLDPGVRMRPTRVLWCTNELVHRYDASTGDWRPPPRGPQWKSLGPCGDLARSQHSMPSCTAQDALLLNLTQPFGNRRDGAES
jgi:hypothetical protein